MRDVCGSAFDSNISKSSRDKEVIGFCEKREERGEAASVRVAN